MVCTVAVLKHDIKFRKRHHQSHHQICYCFESVECFYAFLFNSSSNLFWCCGWFVVSRLFEGYVINFRISNIISEAIVLNFASSVVEVTLSSWIHILLFLKKYNPALLSVSLIFYINSQPFLLFWMCGSYIFIKFFSLLVSHIYGSLNAR
jgi:hypothetical protein